MEDKKKAALYSVIMLICFMAIGFLCSLGVKQNLVRSAHDKMHGERALERNPAQNNPETPCPLVDQPECLPSPDKA